METFSVNKHLLPRQSSRNFSKLLLPSLYPCIKQHLNLYDPRAYVAVKWLRGPQNCAAQSRLEQFQCQNR